MPQRVGVPPNKSIFDRRIRRAQLTSGVDGYEPIDNLGFEVRLNPGRVRRVFWFNQGIDMKGMTVFQSWYYNDTLMSRLAIDIGGNQWRFSTYKTILPHQQGQWRVVTESEEMQPLAELRFQVTY